MTNYSHKLPLFKHIVFYQQWPSFKQGNDLYLISSLSTKWNHRWSCRKWKWRKKTCYIKKVTNFFPLSHIPWHFPENSNHENKEKILRERIFRDFHLVKITRGLVSVLGISFFANFFLFTFFCIFLYLFYQQWFYLQPLNLATASSGHKLIMFVGFEITRKEDKSKITSS